MVHLNSSLVILSGSTTPELPKTQTVNARKVNIDDRGKCQQHPGLVSGGHTGI